MSKLAVLGGKPVTADLVGKGKLKRRPDLERKYLLETYDSGIWDDWPGSKGTAAKFQKEWAAFTKSKHCALLTNGTHTMQVALEALGIGPGDEVIVPGLTWQATASVVVNVNAVPIIVDVDPATGCMDPDRVEEAITPRTRCLIPVHLYHRMADMDRLMKIARKHGLHIIEDCAHTHGSEWDGKGAGTLGTFGSYSFQSFKLMKSAEGGALLIQDEDLYWRIVTQKSGGRQYVEGIRIHSDNFRMTGFQAAILRGQLAAHKRNAPVIDRAGKALDQAVAAAPGVRPLRRNRHISRQVSYGHVFLYDKEAFDGLPTPLFRKALSAETGTLFRTYQNPLNDSPVYYPHTKKRHHLSPAYVKAITPTRFKLPVCDRLFRDEAVLTGWAVFACPPSRARLLTDALVKVYEHRHDLLKAEI